MTAIKSAEVFVSYSSRDSATVLPLIRGLEREGVSVWRDGDRILGGQHYAEQIVHALAHSKVVLLACSPNSFGSDNVHREVCMTWDYYHKRFIPVWLSAPGPIPERFQYQLAGCQWVNAAGRPVEAVVADLLTALESLGVATCRMAAPADDEPKPVPGLRFYPGARPLPGIDWELTELLGRGGFGEVWKARNPMLPGQQPVALKFCTDLDGRSRELLRHEAEMALRAQATVGESGIVPLRHAYLNNDPPCLEYPFVEGGTLVRLIEESRAAGTPFSPAQTMRIVQRIARTVGGFHRANPPLVHCDLKPANILAKREPGKITFRVTDFGIGRVAAKVDIDRARSSRSMEGRMASVLTGAHTPLYASPQQLRGDPPRPTDDVFALGVIWYHLLVGDLTLPAPGGLKWAEPLRKRGMTEPAIQLLASCFETDPIHRPADGVVLADRIEDALKGVGSQEVLSLDDAEPATPTAKRASATTVPRAIPVTRSGGAATAAVPATKTAPKPATARPPAAETRRPTSDRTARGRPRPEGREPDDRPPRRRSGRWVFGCFACLLVAGGTAGGMYYFYGRLKAERSIQDLTRKVDELLLNANDDEAALTLTNEAVRWNPSSPLAWCERGRVRMDRKEYDEAIRDLDEAIRLDPRFALAFARRGRTYSLKKDFDRGFKDCDRAVELDPKLPRAYVNRAFVLKDKGMIAQAIHDMDEAIKLEPDSLNYNERGRFYTELDADKAIADFTESIKIKPNHWAFANRARQYLGKADADPANLDKAIADCTEAIKVNPRYAYAYFVRGWCHAEKKDYDKAEADLGDAIKLDRRDAEAYFQRGFVFARREKFDAAIPDYKAAADLGYSPKWYAVNNLAGAYVSLAESALDKGDADAARDANEKSLRLRDEFLAERPWHVMVRWGRSANHRLTGRWWEKKDNPKNAAEAYQRASDEGNAEASKRLAELYQTGTGVTRDTAKAAALRKKAEGQSVKRFTVPCLMGGYEKRVPLAVYVTTPLDDKEDDPLAGEAKRLKEDHNATLPPEVAESFKKLLRVARENGVSFPDLCTYALGSATKDDAAVELFTNQLQKAYGGFLTFPAGGKVEGNTITWQVTVKKKPDVLDLTEIEMGTLTLFDTGGKQLRKLDLDKVVSFSPDITKVAKGGTAKCTLRLPTGLKLEDVGRVGLNW